MLEHGRYSARAMEWQIGKAGTGTEQLGVSFEVTQGEAAGERITWYGYFTDKGFEITAKALRACGWMGTDLSDLTGLDTNEVQIVVEHEVSEADGNTYAKVKWVNKPGGIAMKELLGGNDLKSFAARMKGPMLNFDRSAGAPAPQRQASPPARTQTTPRRAPHREEPPPITDEQGFTRGAAPSEDDIPF